MHDKPTHVIGWVQRKHHDGTIYFAPEIFDDFDKACQSISGWNQEVVIKSLKEGIEITKSQKYPLEDDLVGLPRIGQTIWAVKDWGESRTHEDRYEALEVTVTELGIDDDGEIMVIFGFYYKKKGGWFYTKNEAENHRRKLVSGDVVEE